MTAIQTELEVLMEGEQPYIVVADQRDLARWEVQDFAGPNRKFTLMRFIAWSASLRQGKTILTWPDFDATCVEVGDPAPEDTVLDPTKPAASGDN